MLRSQVAVAVAVALSVAVCRCRAEEVIHSFHAPAHPCRFCHSPAMWFSAPEACHCASPSGICICLLLIPAGTSEGETKGQTLAFDIPRLLGAGGIDCPCRPDSTTNHALLLPQAGRTQADDGGQSGLWALDSGLWRMGECTRHGTGNIFHQSG